MQDEFGERERKSRACDMRGMRSGIKGEQKRDLVSSSSSPSANSTAKAVSALREPKDRKERENTRRMWGVASLLPRKAGCSEMDP